MTDLSRVEAASFKENYLLMLGFPNGYVPLRVIAREHFIYMYDPLNEGQILGPVAAATIGYSANGISDLGYVQPQRLPSRHATGQPIDIFQIDMNHTDEMYQLFFGIAPSAIRVFINEPASTGQNNLVSFSWGPNNMAFGYIDGYISPLENPSPASEILVPPNMEFALGYANPLPNPVVPLLLFYVNRLKVNVVRDVQLVMKMLDGRVPVAIRTVGGLSSYTYKVNDVYKINPIALGSTEAEVRAALGVR
jgi:hypothetical protein